MTPLDVILWCLLAAVGVGALWLLHRACKSIDQVIGAPPFVTVEEWRRFFTGLRASGVGDHVLETARRSAVRSGFRLEDVDPTQDGEEAL